MLKLLILIVFAGFVHISSTMALGQEKLTPEDELVIEEAGKTADRFIERFRQTLDFARTWREFRTKDFSCAIRGDYVLNRAMRDRYKPNDAYLENVYTSTFNMYYLQAAYEMSRQHMSAPNDKPEMPDPKELRLFKSRSKLLSGKGDDPKTLKQVNRAVSEMNALSGLYRKFMPKDALHNKIWISNVKYFAEYQPDNNSGVQIGSAQMCIPSPIKLFTFERGPFYFYFVKEGEKLKIAGFGID